MNAGNDTLNILKADALARGKAEEFDAIQYVQVLSKYLSRSFGIRGSAVDDISSACLCQLVKELRDRRNQGPLENEEYWVRKVARYRIIDALRKERTLKAKLVKPWGGIPDPDLNVTDEVPVDMRDIHSPDPRQEPEYLDLAKRVREVVASLPDNLQDLCMLLLVEDEVGHRLTEDEIALALKTSRSQLRRMRSRLQSKFISAGFADFQKRMVPAETPGTALSVGEDCHSAPIPSERRSSARPQPRVMVKNASRSSARTLAAVSANY
ncbi:MAG: RNA polymerase sigma factor [Terriglobia bacterium]